MKTTDHWDDIVSYYNKLVSDWYIGSPKYSKADLRRIPDGCSDSDGYSHDGNYIQLNAPEREIDLPNIDDLLSVMDSDALKEEYIHPNMHSQLVGTNECKHGPWPEWMKALVHEAIHEYEKKIIGNAITQKGVVLHEANTANNFAYPEKHGEAFYTAIADRAAYFDMTPQELREHI